MKRQAETGQVRVGRRKYFAGGTYVDPAFPGFTPVVSMTPSTKFGCISPYVLKTPDGVVLENAWQFSKVYPQVPATRQVYSRYDARVIWEHAAETHYTNGTLMPEFFAWRSKGFSCADAIRYPVGLKHMHECIGAFLPGSDELLDYVSARKRIYVPLFLEAVQRAPAFISLQERLARGENLLIIEVDGPHQETIEHYKHTYGVDSTFIERDTTLATPRALNIFLHDTKHPFGHGYCIAWALLQLPPPL